MTNPAASHPNLSSHSRAFITAAVMCVLTLINSARAESAAAAPAAGNRIINGANVPASQFPTVGEIGDSSDTTFYYCTGTLISPKHVLTAGHCLTDSKGALSVAQTNALFRLNGVVYHSLHIFVHPAWKGGNNGDAEGEFDAIVVELDTAVPGVTPTPLYRQAPTVGQVLTIAGYGELGTGSSGRNGQTPAAGTINFGPTPIDIVTATYIKWNFENKQPQETNTAPGDSGGPAFITVNGVMTLAGITNGGSLDSAGYGDQSYDTRVDAIAAWVDQVTNGATNGGAGGGGGGSAPAGDNPPVIASAASVSSASPKPKTSVMFTVSATDPDSDALTYSWDFGDGSQANGANVNHSYTSNGSYTATVTVNDGRGGTVSSSVNVDVGGGGAASGTPIGAQNCKFKLNFKTGGRDSIDLTFNSSTFQYSDRRTFGDTVDGLQATVSVGGTEIDTLDIVKSGAGTGDGKLHWNPRNGTIRYTLHNTDIADLLSSFGAVNDDTQTSVTVPLAIQIDGVTYTASYTFSYKARADISGQAK